MTNEIKENTPLLNAIGLKKYYPVKKGLFAKALDGVSFQLERGKTLAVVGESGCGKSTLGRLLTMIEQPTEGELYYKGHNFLENDPETKALRRKKIQIVFQNPYASLNPRKKIGSILEEPLLINTKLSAKERREKVLSMMKKVGLRAEFYDRYPHMFSGGQRQRIAIARGLMLEPDVVVADEPVSALDVSVRAQVLNLMMDLQDELGLSYVFISHDLSVVEHIADEGKLLKAVNQRSSGSDLDKQKLAEKVRAAIGRLRRLGMIQTVGEQNSGKFTISESVFRFGAEVRSGDDPLEAQARLIRDGEAATPESLALEKQAQLVENDAESADEIDEEFDGEQE